MVKFWENNTSAYLNMIIYDYYNSLKFVEPEIINNTDLLNQTIVSSSFTLHLPALVTKKIVKEVVSSLKITYIIFRKNK